MRSASEYSLWDKHKQWPDLLGTVALAYNATVLTSTGYSLHELIFYSFAPACLLDTLVTTPMPELASNADKYALQAMEWLQEAAEFVLTYTEKLRQQMKVYYDTTVKLQKFEEGEEVLLFNPRNKTGQYAKWPVARKGALVVKRRLNDSNYVLQRESLANAKVNVWHHYVMKIRKM